MVTVKVYGLFRLDSGIKEYSADVKSVKQLYAMLLDEAKRINPNTTVSAADINSCIAIVNGKPGKKNTRLNDGDIVMLMSPVCGG